LRQIKAQSILEYSIVLGLVASALFLMQFYIQGAIKQVIRLSSNRLGNPQKSLAYYEPAKNTFVSDLGSYATVDSSGTLRLEDKTSFALSSSYLSWNQENVFNPFNRQDKEVAYYDIENVNLNNNSGVWVLKNYTKQE